MRRHTFGLLRWLPGLLAALVSGFVQAEPAPVLIGVDAEFSIPNSTSGEAIRLGMLTAIDEINSAGGVLGGRPLRLEMRDNRSVPARGTDNLRELAALPDLVAVYCSKYSPVCAEQAPLAEQLRVLLLDPWAAADEIVPKTPAGSYVFRLSMRDSWAVPVMMRYLGTRGVRQVGVLLPMSSWGRSNEATLGALANQASLPKVVAKEWYPWGTASLKDNYLKLLGAGATGVILVGNEREGALLVKELASLAPHQRVPLASHWGITGGPFTEMTGDALRQVDLSVVQIFTLHGRTDVKARSVVERAGRLFRIKGTEDIPSHAGFGHAYDLTHILARAIDLAGSTQRAAVRDAMEQVRNYQGLVATLPQPFSPGNHEALSPSMVFMGRFSAGGSVVRIVR